jgi:hypothetical protein
VPVPLARRALIAASTLGLVFLTTFVPTTEASAQARTTDSVVSPKALLPSLSIHPLSASTCSDNVCIFVTGVGLNVSDWSTSAYISKAMCSTPEFLVNGSVRRTGVQTCGSAGYELGSDWSNPGNFPNGTQLCNEWTGVAGEPCVTVHS